MNTDGIGFHTCKECHKTESIWNHTTTDHKEGNNWKTEEALARAAVTLETNGLKGPIVDIYDDDDDDDDNDDKDIGISKYSLSKFTKC